MLAFQPALAVSGSLFLFMVGGLVSTGIAYEIGPVLIRKVTHNTFPENHLCRELPMGDRSIPNLFCNLECVSWSLFNWSSF